MKKNYFALAMACMLAFALVGCSSDKNKNSSNLETSNSPTIDVQTKSPENSAGMATDNSDRNSAGMNGGGGSDSKASSGTGGESNSQNSVGMRNTDSRQTADVNDANEGGGAGGTNDVDNDGQPDSKSEIRTYNRINGVGNDLDNGVGNTLQGIGNAGKDVGDAVKGMIDDVERANR